MSLCKVAPDSEAVSASTELIFLLSSVAGAKTCKLRWDWGSDSLCFDVKAKAKCGSLFKLDRVEFVCTFEPFTPLPLHRFYQPGPSVYLPTQTWTHFSTKSCIKDTQHHGAWELTSGHSEEKNMWTMITEQIKMWTAICVNSFVFILNYLRLLLKMSLKWDFCLLSCSNWKHNKCLLSLDF